MFTGSASMLRAQPPCYGLSLMLRAQPPRYGLSLMLLAQFFFKNPTREKKNL